VDVGGGLGIAYEAGQSWSASRTMRRRSSARCAVLACN
jgi:hypothetical protein